MIVIITPQQSAKAMRQVFDGRNQATPTLTASIAELKRQWEERVRRDRLTARPEVFNRIKVMLLHHRFIRDDQKYRFVESSEILSWLREATGMTEGKGG